jgi:5-methyltetrahydrofolate--homocysteine methyltransferase
VPFIDWSPFFHTWELRGVYPKILQHEKHGEEARKLFADAQNCWKKIVAKKLLGARRLRLVPGQSRRRRRGTLHRRSRAKVLTTFHFLRQQIEKDRRHAQLVPGGFHRAQRAARAQ